MGAFWNDWQLWEKMCFVLGVAIVITVILGLFKLTYDSWRLRKFTRIAEEQLEKGLPPMQQRKRRGRADSDVPFGVRAIESGVEVEGVWISRGNSPNSSMPGTPATLVRDYTPGPSKHASRTSIPAISMPKPVYSYSSRASDVSQEEPTPSEPRYDRSVESSRGSSRNPSPNGHHRNSSRPSYKPRHSSQLRYSHGYYREENVYSPDDHFQGVNKPNFSRSSSGSSTASAESVHTPIPQYHRPRRQGSYTSVLPAATPDARQSEIDLMPFTSHSGVDLQPLTSHRRSQVAEMGRLMPPRSHTSSADWSSARSVSKHSIAEEQEVPPPPPPKNFPTNSPPRRSSNEISETQRTEAQPVQSIVQTETSPVERQPSNSKPHSEDQTSPPQSSQQAQSGGNLNMHAGFEFGTARSVSQSWVRAQVAELENATSESGASQTSSHKKTTGPQPSLQPSVSDEI